MGVARLVRACHNASRTRTTPFGSTPTSATPISPINSSRPIVVGFNEAVAPVILRAMLMRSGEAGKKQGVDFAAGGH